MIRLALLATFLFIYPACAETLPQILLTADKKPVSDGELFQKLKKQYPDITEEKLVAALSAQGFKTTNHSAKFRNDLSPCSDNWYIFWERTEAKLEKSKIRFTDAGYIKHCDGQDIEDKYKLIQ